MLTYSMQDAANTPKYLFLYQRIRNDIIAGRIEDGERLPSKRTLAQHLGVGLITVANAYDLLVSEGYATAVERRGYFARVSPTRSHNMKAPHEAKPAASDAANESGLGASSKPHGSEIHTDLRANRTSMRLFPAATWNRLIRKTITQGSALFDVVPYNGLEALRVAIADYLRESRNMQVNPEHIVIGAGTEYLYGRLTQLLGHTRIFGFEDPGYKKLSTICHYSGCESRFIPIDKEGIRMDLLEASDVDIIHVSPANQFPMGSHMSVRRRADLLAWANRSSKRYVVEDDYDSEFRYRGGYLPPLFVQDKNDRVIYLNTFSKTLVPSLRISYMVLPPALMERYRESLSFYSCTVSSFEQLTLAQFISQGYFERHINRLRTYYRKQRSRVIKAIGASPLSAISRIIEHNAGTHLLLQVDTSLAPSEIRAAAETVSLNLSLYVDYTTGSKDNIPKYLVINYAAIEPDEIEPAIVALASMFPECKD